MGLPGFTDEGVLPAGLHEATIDRFGGPGDRGDQIESLRWLMEDPRFGRVERLLINGSFVTIEPQPRDVDCIAVVRSADEIDTVQAVFDELPFLSAEVLLTDELGPMLEFFGTTRAGVPKGLVELVVR